MTAKLEEVNNDKYKIWTRQSYVESEYGFEGEYICELGIVLVYVCQDMVKRHYLRLSFFYCGYEYSKSYECSEKPTYRMASKKARQFLKEILRIK